MTLNKPIIISASIVAVLLLIAMTVSGWYNKEANSTTDITIFIIVLFIINLIICGILFKENVIDNETYYR